MSKSKTVKADIGRYYQESIPCWQEPLHAPEKAPNILFIVLDDVGFAQLGCYGSDIATSNMDRLADEGVMYTNFHTAAMCSPTRSCVLTGRNHHTNGMGCIAEYTTGFPGYSAKIPRENGFLSEILSMHGYACYALGKWHLTPDYETNMAATKERWPLGRGFERFYGFLGGHTDQYEPNLIYDNHSITPPKPVSEGYHLTEDLTDKAIEFITDLKNVDPEKPFFMYFSPGAMHAPHQAPKEWIDKYRGKFDPGWESWREEIHQRQLDAGVIPPGTELPPRPEWVQDWESLSEDEKRLYARFMEVFAGFLEHTDDHIGRLIDFLKDIGQYENTLIVLISDNGASSEGGPHGSINEACLYNSVPFTVEENLKMMDKLGGPESYPNYPWGWTWAGNTPLKRWKRETHVAEDFSESRDLSDRYPDKLRELQELWWAEAGRYNVLPLDDRGGHRFLGFRPKSYRDREAYIYYPFGAPVGEGAAVDVKNRSHEISAEVEIPEQGAEGVLMAHGGRYGGYSFYVKDEKLHYVHNFLNLERYTVTSEFELPRGSCTLKYRFEKTGTETLGAGGIGRLFINDHQVAEGEIPRTIGLRYHLADDGLCCGYDGQTPTTEDYRSPFRFTGTLNRVVVTTEGKRHDDEELRLKIAKARQ